MNAARSATGARTGVPPSRGIVGPCLCLVLGLGLGLGPLACNGGSGNDGDETSTGALTEGTDPDGPVTFDSTADPQTTDEPCPPGEFGCSCASGDTCSPGLLCQQGTCVSEIPGCGNGTVEGDEECDEGSDLDDEGECKTNCTLASCGDGLLGPGEVCDDGNLIDHDQCSNACQPAACGDGILQDGEACDDANQEDGDACTNACAAAECGDSIVQQGVEACDDGNGSNEDACTNACNDASCGDGFLWMGQEECDGTLLAGQTCVTQGFTGGTLSCSASCSFDTSGCTSV